MAKLQLLSVFAVIFCLVATSLAARNFTVVLEKCASMELTSPDNPHVLTHPGLCYKFECHVTKEHEDFHTGKVQPISCPSVTAIAPCTINMGDSSQQYPNCCPFKQCPNGGT